MDDSTPRVPAPLATSAPSFPSAVRAGRREMRDRFKALMKHSEPDELLRFVEAQFRNAQYDLEEDVLERNAQYDLEEDAARGGKHRVPPRAFAVAKKGDDEDDSDSVYEDESGDEDYDSDFAEEEDGPRMSRHEARDWWQVEGHLKPTDSKRKPLQNQFFVPSMDTTAGTEAEQRYSKDPSIKRLKTQRMQTQEMIRWINSNNVRSPSLHVFEDLLRLIDPKLHREEQKLYRLSQHELRRRERQPRVDSAVSKNDKVEISQVARRQQRLVYTPIETKEEVFFKGFFTGKTGKRWWELRVSTQDAELMRSKKLRRVLFLAHEDGYERMRIPCNSKHLVVENTEVVESDDDEGSEFSPDEDGSGSSDSSCSSESDNLSDDAVDGPKLARQRQKKLAQKVSSNSLLRAST